MINGPHYDPTSGALEGDFAYGMKMVLHTQDPDLGFSLIDPLGNELRSFDIMEVLDNI